MLHSNKESTIREGFVTLINDSKHEHNQKFISMTINHSFFDDSSYDNKS